MNWNYALLFTDYLWTEYTLLQYIGISYGGSAHMALASPLLLYFISLLEIEISLETSMPVAP